MFDNIFAKSDNIYFSEGRSLIISVDFFNHILILILRKCTVT